MFVATIYTNTIQEYLCQYVDCRYTVWQYGLWSFQGRDTKLERFLAKNQLKSSSLAETANRAESGQLQFWSEPSEILNLRSSSTPETVAFTIP